MEMMDPNENEVVLLYPLMGEKATMLREKENKLTFIVNEKSTKRDIKDSIENLYQAKVLKVNLLRTPEGKKKAVVKLSEEFSAEEIASKFGVL
jgi:large subunit ribosomal protein L23